MALPKGVYAACTKNGTPYYRVSITYKNKHISLGSYTDITDASNAYLEADLILHSDMDLHIYNEETHFLDFAKWVSLMNFRDHGMYFKTPIYLQNKYFLYYFSPSFSLKFDVDDLFYYSTHTIMRKNGYLFVADYGMQVNVLSRYGIRSHAVPGRDYIFANGDETDYRYNNIKIINRYYGVQSITKDGRTLYKVKIHINGDFVVGTYQSETEAAIAYNKAAAVLRERGITINYPENYIDDISSIQYASIYNSVKLSKKIREYKNC